MKHTIVCFMFFLFWINANAQNNTRVYFSDGRNQYADLDSLIYQLATSNHDSQIESLHELYYYYYEKVSKAEKSTLLNRMREAASLHKSEWLHIEADFFETDTDEKLLDFILKQKKDKNIQMQIRGLLKLQFRYWSHEKYAKMFRLVEEIETLIKKTPINTYYEKEFYYQTGYAYYVFRDYDKAIEYLKKSLGEPANYYHRNDLQAKSTLGIYYRLKQDLDSSDYYFRNMLNQPYTVYWKDVHESIAGCSLARNMFFRKEYDTALSYFYKYLPRMIKLGDYSFASFATYSMAEIYLAKQNLPEAGRMIDSTLVYIERSGNVDRFKDIYLIMSKYYSQKGEPAKASAYLDSAKRAKDVYDNKFNALVILRAEQEVFEAKKDQMELEATNYRTRIIGLIVISIVLLIALFLFCYLYQKKKKAYQKLVEKSKQWATIPIMPKTSEPNNKTAITSESEKFVDEEFMKQVCETIKKEKLYLQPDLDIEQLANVMNVKVIYLSKVINQTMHINFKSLINEYRIKEAVKLLSDNHSFTKIDTIAFESGFSDRSSFYRVFKKITGLTPTEFKANSKN